MNNDLFWIDTMQALIYEYIEKQTLLSHLDNELKRILTENVFVPSDVDDIRHKLLNHKNDKNIIESILKVN